LTSRHGLDHGTALSLDRAEGRSAL
jgi:hypothetical protein